MPAPVKIILLPLMVALPEIILYDTANPDDAVAFKANGEAENICAGIVLKEIVCGPCTTIIVSNLAGAAA